MADDKNQIIEIRKSLLKTGETELDILPPCDGNRGGGTDGITKEGMDEDGDIAFRVGMMRPGQNDGLHYCVGLEATEVPFTPDQFYVHIYSSISPDWSGSFPPPSGSIPTEHNIQLCFDILSDPLDPIPFVTTQYWTLTQGTQIDFDSLDSRFPDSCGIGSSYKTIWFAPPFDGGSATQILTATSIMNTWIVNNKPDRLVDWSYYLVGCDSPYYYIKENQPTMLLVGEQTDTGEKKTLATILEGDIDTVDYIAEIDWSLTGY